jgi:hypothetical protein
MNELDLSMKYHLEYVDGRQDLVRVVFPNGYTGSILNSGYGKHYEVAVVAEGKIVYDTPIANDVMPGLNREEVMQKLHKISQLPKR